MDSRLPSTAFADAWTQVDRTEDPAFFVGLLDATRADLLERARRAPADFFREHDLKPGLRVLDAGCGTGDMLRIMAPLVAPGSCVGIDVSETMIGEARRRAEGMAGLSFTSGDVQALTFGDSAFDRVTATQVLVHVREPGVALAELHRVLSPGGRIVIGEVDWDSTGLECTNRELSRRFTRVATDELRNGFIVRELPWRLREAGFVDVGLTPHVTTAQVAGAFQRWFVEPAMKHFARIGAFTDGEIEEFLADLEARSRSGRYFLTRTDYTISATRPS